MANPETGGYVPEATGEKQLSPVERIRSTIGYARKAMGGGERRIAQSVFFEVEEEELEGLAQFTEKNPSSEETKRIMALFEDYEEKVTLLVMEERAMEMSRNLFEREGGDVYALTELDRVEGLTKEGKRRLAHEESVELGRKAWREADNYRNTRERYQKMRESMKAVEKKMSDLAKEILPQREDDDDED